MSTPHRQLAERMVYATPLLTHCGRDETARIISQYFWESWEEDQSEQLLIIYTLKLHRANDMRVGGNPCKEGKRLKGEKG